MRLLLQIKTWEFCIDFQDLFDIGYYTEDSPCGCGITQLWVFSVRKQSPVCATMQKLISSELLIKGEENDNE